MRSFDGAEICELLGLYALNNLCKRFGGNNIGLYRDDGLALIKGTSLRLTDKARKDRCSQFQEFGLKITAEVNHKTVNFLDVILNLTYESYKPFRKPNNDPLNIHKESNHPPSITKQLPAAINRINARTNIARYFLKLIVKHFSKSASLHKIFHRNIQVSYSCINNFKSVI